MFYSFPPELLLQIIYQLRTESSIDYHTLLSLPLISRRFNESISKNRRDIIDYYTIMTIEHSGDICYRLGGRQHRDNDKPAIICANGVQYWYTNGKLHRDNDQPAIIYENGTQCWYTNGMLHRDNDLPALIYADGSRSWYINGKFHRRTINLQ